MGGRGLDKGLDHARRSVGFAETVTAGLVMDLHDDGFDEAIEIAAIGIGNGERNDFDARNRGEVAGGVFFLCHVEDLRNEDQEIL